jgi:hypothetical protein
MAEQRDETHVEQHGDGDVNVTTDAPADTGGDTGGEAAEDTGGEE